MQTDFRIMRSLLEYLLCFFSILFTTNKLRRGLLCGHLLFVMISNSVSSNGSLSIILQEQILSAYQEFIFASFVSHAKSFKFNNKPLVLPLRLLVQSCPDSIERNRKRDNSGY